MGAGSSGITFFLRGQKINSKCYPSIPYQPFPVDVHTPKSDGLVTELKALPPAFGCVPFVGTRSTAYPKVQPHPTGELLAFVRGGNTSIITLENLEVYSQPQDLSSGTCRYCALAPNGLNLATISRSQGFYRLRLYVLDHSVYRDGDIGCHKLCSGFEASRKFNDHVECKWSQDSKYLAISSSLGKLFVVKRSSLTNVCTVCPDVTDQNISNAESFDFDPRFEHSVLAIGSQHDKIFIIDIESKRVLLEFGSEEVNEKIDCVLYNVDGTALAVAYRNLFVKLYNPDDGTEVFSLNMQATCHKLVTHVPSGPNPAIMRLSFSFDGSLLTTSTCDGYVRVWNIPQSPSLQQFCKLKILSMLPIRAVKKLNLPSKIKNFLLSV